MNLWQAIRRGAMAVERAIDALDRRWSPAPPDEFVRAADRYLSRGEPITQIQAVELFELAAPLFQWRTRPGARRRWLQKSVGDRYIVRCLHHVIGIRGEDQGRAFNVRVRTSAARWTWAEAMGVAFDDMSAGTIAHAWDDERKRLK